MFLILLVVVLLSNEFIYYTDDKIIIYSFILAVFLLYKLAGKMLWKDFRILGMHIKEEYFYYQYINLIFLNLLADLSLKLLKFKKVSFMIFGMTVSILRILNKYERFLFADKLVYSQIKASLVEVKG
jgi:hypothetical protein